MKTGFLIVNYNDHETTSTLLDNIKSYSILDLIVVVDNNSTDDSYLKLKEKYQRDNVMVIQTSENKGYAYGINFGCKYMMSQIGECNIFVSNADIVIHSEDDLVSLLHNKTKDCAILAPIIKEHTGLNRGWKIPSPFQDALLNLVGIHKILKPKMLYYKNHYYENDLVEVEAVSGCFFMIDSNDLKQVNYFDENTFLYYEENIISKKLQIINKKIMINTKVEVFHNHSISIDKNINRMMKYQILKKSQYYFQTEYNHANRIERRLLKFTSGFSACIFKVFKRG